MFCFFHSYAQKVLCSLCQALCQSSTRLNNWSVLSCAWLRYSKLSIEESRIIAMTWLNRRPILRIWKTCGVAVTTTFSHSGSLTSEQFRCRMRAMITSISVAVLDPRRALGSGLVHATTSLDLMYIAPICFPQGNECIFNTKVCILASQLTQRT